MIESYTFGQMVIDGQTYIKDLILLPDEILSSWWRKTGHHVCLEDLEKALEADPEILIIGTGYLGLMKVDRDVEEHTKNRDIELITLKTKEAVKVFNGSAPSKKTVAAFHLTC
jgi:hypothetical protein